MARAVQESSPRPTVEGYLGGHGRERGDVLRAAKAVLDEALPGATVGLKWGYPTWTGNGNVASLLAYPGHVNLQLFQGARLADPKGLLEGTGVTMRHVKLRSVRDLKDPAVKALLRHAWRLDQA